MITRVGVTTAEGVKAGLRKGMLGSRRAFVLVLPLARLLGGTLAIAAVVGAGIAGYGLSAGPEAVERLWAPADPVKAVDGVLDMPELIVNLRRDTPSRYLKIGISLEVTADGRERTDRMMPQLTDSLEEFLRNLDQDDLEGSAGLYRLRTEIKRRFNLILSDTGNRREVVIDVLLRSLLTQ